MRLAAMSSDAARVEWFVIPVTIDDLAANGLLERLIRRCAGSARSRRSRQGRTDIAGLAVASDEQIEAYLLYMRHETKCGDHRRFARSSRMVERV